MRFFIAQIATETNTFAATPTGLGAFEECGIFDGDGSLKAPDTTGAVMLAYRRMMEADGHEVVEGLCALAEPSGRTVRTVYEALRERLLAGLRAAMPVDAVQLMLHGAMVADGYDDCEGDILARVREIVGPGVPVGAELDLHCHFTEQMRASADAIIAFKEYPHTDIVKRGRELYRILADTHAGRVRPVTAVFDCKMVGTWQTTREPMAGFVRRMQALEGRDGVLSVSLGHGFPWGDVRGSGARLWVVTDNNPALAAKLAGQLAREFWELRERAGSPVQQLDAALDQALELARSDGGPVVLADVADNPGGGAPGDATFILRRLFERGIGNAAIGAFWDLGAIQICRDAGAGAALDLRVGGKCGPSSGQPLDLRVTVRAVAEQHTQSAAAIGGRAPLGTCVWLEGPNNVHILLASVRGQVFAPDAFTGVGLSLDDKQLVVVKSAIHFHAEFAPIASAVLYASTPGAIAPDFADLPYQVRTLDYWPRVARPHADWR
ncbi:M81 family metallopeptidase [Pseudoduganella sp. UC29_71]|uniref:M81 family metallopeptidase n=1 Tax=Pseudoduganella sp. UC29_71 TaxID=3350174 RepID=UPI0036724165